ncbi:hypothetical protein DM02DRAFT_89895 [Periconia macrospinosa]|uniref:Uncharacterized protein n=1 Tax=Periconia macrospinosa TaxID=97972 RepID=A0A2V1DIW7_9PLEO|nr:hypothetical protein DM02DRAFT_89895 [Periconia macrospinosa]
MSQPSKRRPTRHSISSPPTSLSPPKKTANISLLESSLTTNPQTSPFYSPPVQTHQFPTEPHPPKTQNHKKAHKPRRNHQPTPTVSSPPPPSPIPFPAISPTLTQTHSPVTTLHRISPIPHPSLL